MKQQMADMENEIEIDDYEAMDVGYNDDRNEDASSGSNSEDDVVDNEMTAAQGRIQTVSPFARKTVRFSDLS